MSSCLGKLYIFSKRILNFANTGINIDLVDIYIKPSKSNISAPLPMWISTFMCCCGNRNWNTFLKRSLWTYQGRSESVFLKKSITLVGSRSGWLSGGSSGAIVVCGSGDCWTLVAGQVDSMWTEVNKCWGKNFLLNNGSGNWFADSQLQLVESHILRNNHSLLISIVAPVRLRIFITANKNCGNCFGL